MIFSPPMRRTGYLVRHPAEAWIDALAVGFDRNPHHADMWDEGKLPELSAALNNFAFLLFKAGLLDAADDLCTLHCRALIRRDAGLAVQPWINRGRLQMRRGRFAEARAFLLIDPSAARIDGIDVGALDAEAAEVCRNVAIVDGFFLAMAEHGVHAAEHHLLSGPPTVAVDELLLQIALSRGDHAEVERRLAAIGGDDGYAPAICCYNAAVAARRGDDQVCMRWTLLLIALLNDDTASADDTASILHALLWLCDNDRRRFESVTAGRVMSFLSAKAIALGDVELQCRLQGRRYDPLPQNSAARRMALDLLDRCRDRLHAPNVCATPA
jgi:hypothetical protein